MKGRRKVKVSFVGNGVGVLIRPPIPPVGYGNVVMEGGGERS